MRGALSRSLPRRLLQFRGTAGACLLVAPRYTRKGRLAFLSTAPVSRPRASGPHISCPTVPPMSRPEDRSGSLLSHPVHLSPGGAAGKSSGTGFGNPCPGVYKPYNVYKRWPSEATETRSSRQPRSGAGIPLGRTWAPPAPLRTSWRGKPSVSLSNNTRFSSTSSAHAHAHRI